MFTAESRKPRGGQGAFVSPLVCLSRVYFSRYPSNGELARRLQLAKPCVCWNLKLIGTYCLWGNYNFDPLLRLGVHSGRGFLLAIAVFSTLLKRTFKNLKNNKQTNRYLSLPRPLAPPTPSEKKRK